MSVRIEAGSHTFVIDGNEIDRIQADHMAAAREWNAVRMGRCG